MTPERRLVGHVWVDSGSLMICDPCYISSSWKKGAEFQDIRKYRDKSPGRKGVYQYQIDFPNYEFKLFENYPHTPNECINEGKWEHIPNEVVRDFSDEGATSVTLSEEGHGNLGRGKADQGGLGFVSQTHHGDGEFPVYLHFKQGENRPYKMEVIFG